MGECSVSRDQPHNTSVPNALAARPRAGIFTARSAWHALERRVTGFRVVVGAACDSAVVVSIGRRPAPRCGGMAQGKKGLACHAVPPRTVQSEARPCSVSAAGLVHPSYMSVAERDKQPCDLLDCAHSLLLSPQCWGRAAAVPRVAR